MSEDKTTTVVPRGMEIVTPTPGKFSSQDLQRWVHNTLKFSAGPLIVFFTALGAGVELKTALLTMTGPFISLIIDYLTKLRSDTPYLQDK